MLRVALFFDGKNFYKSLEQNRIVDEIDYGKFAAWIALNVGGNTAAFVGAHYYTGHSNFRPDAGRRLGNFLAELELVTGYFIHREPIVRRSTWCKKCGLRYRYGAEKRVDTRLVADMIQYAAVDAYDLAVLISGDQDFLPAVEAVQRLGKQVYIGTWGRRGLNRQLRAESFGEIEFSAGLDDFSTGKKRTPHGQQNRRVRTRRSHIVETQLVVDESSVSAVTQVTDITAQSVISSAEAAAKPVIPGPPAAPRPGGPRPPILFGKRASSEAHLQDFEANAGDKDFAPAVSISGNQSIETNPSATAPTPKSTMISSNGSSVEAYANLPTEQVMTELRRALRWHETRSRPLSVHFFVQNWKTRRNIPRNLKRAALQALQQAGRVEEYIALTAQGERLLCLRSITE